MDSIHRASVTADHLLTFIVRADMGAADTREVLAFLRVQRQKTGGPAGAFLDAACEFLEDILSEEDSATKAQEAPVCNCRDCIVCKGERTICGECHMCVNCHEHAPGCEGCKGDPGPRRLR